MTFFTPTNEKRVEKICEIVLLIQKSVQSNSASSEDVWKLMDPAIKDLEELLGEPPKPEGYPVKDPEPKKPRHNPDSEERPSSIIRRAAEEASLKDLTYAMAVYLNRIDEHLKP